MNLQTPQEHVLTQLVTYPSLYSFSTFDAVKLKVLDQLLNVIGNGVRDTEELLENLKVVLVDISTASRLITSEPLYYGYYKVRKIGSFEMGEGDSIDVLESDRVNYPDVVYWLEASRHSDFAPYPNFKEDYSIVYRSDFHLLGPDWAEAAIWYYKQAQKFFETTPEKYHYAFPCASDRESNNQLADFTERLKSYANNEEISIAYELEYTGDPAEFLTRRWQKELTRINQFIANTITKLENQTY